MIARILVIFSSLIAHSVVHPIYIFCNKKFPLFINMRESASVSKTIAMRCDNSIITVLIFGTIPLLFISRSIPNGVIKSHIEPWKTTSKKTKLVQSVSFVFQREIEKFSSIAARRSGQINPSIGYYNFLSFALERSRPDVRIKERKLLVLVDSNYYERASWTKASAGIFNTNVQSEITYRSFDLQLLGLIQRQIFQYNCLVQ